MGQRIDDRLVRRLTPPATGNRIVYDDELKGFGVRVTAKGVKSFILNYRINGRERRYTIGQFGPAWNSSAARLEAGRKRRDVDQGVDPLNKRNADRDAPTVAQLCDDYLARHAPKKRTEREDRRKIEKQIRPRLGKLKVGDVTVRDVEDLHRAMKDTPYEANRTLALLSRMFNLAVRWDWRADNPCRGVEKFEEHRRERYLTAKELVRLVEALDAYPHQNSANAVRLLMLTGARRGEVLKMRWDQIDFERGEWIKPSAHTKTKRVHRVPLSPPALALLSAMQGQSETEWVFPGKTDPKTGIVQPLMDIKKCWYAVCKTAKLVETFDSKTRKDKHGQPVKISRPTVRVHDLRHTYASILASSGLSLPIIGRLLGHTQPATTARYAHLFDDPLREATGRVAEVLAGAGKRDQGDIVDLKTGESR